VAEASFSEKDCYDCLVDIENWLGKSIAELTPINPKMTLKGKGRRKTTALPIKVSAHSGPARAGEIVAYGVKKGWVQATKLT
jgi:serine/threonine-protein kinase haspin